MSLSFVQTSPGFILAGAVGCIGYSTFVQNKGPSWKLPAFVSAAFWGFTLYTISQEGLFGFWNNHIQNYWGNQVFFDLCFSVALFWLALLPRAQALAMPLAPWCFYVSTTASLGGLHMYARILYLEEKQRNKTNNDDGTLSSKVSPSSYQQLQDNRNKNDKDENSDKKLGYTDEK